MEVFESSIVEIPFVDLNEGPNMCSLSNYSVATDVFVMEVTNNLNANIPFQPELLVPASVNDLHVRDALVDSGCHACN